MFLISLFPVRKNNSECSIRKNKPQKILIRKAISIGSNIHSKEFKNGKQG